MELRTGELSDGPEDERSSANERSPSDIPVEELRREAIEQIAREKGIGREDDLILAKVEPPLPGRPLSEPAEQKKDRAFYARAIRANFRILLDFGQTKKTSRLII